MFNNNGYANPVSSLLTKIYAWMSGGLLLTAGVAYYISNQPNLIQFFFGNPWLLFGIIFLQLGLVIVLSAGVSRMSFTSAAATFLFYSALNGITLSSIFLVYTSASIALAFLVTSGMFLGMALYGYLTKADLSSMGSFLFMALIGLIISSVLNIFFKSDAFSFFLSGAGVIIFSLLTAYDVQRLKALSYQLSDESAAKVSILGALTLYLDFINLFLFVLRFMGQRRD